MSIIDSGKPILIDHDKKIINMKEFSQAVVQGDTNSIVMSFGIPSLIENINPLEYQVRVLYKVPNDSYTYSSECSMEQNLETLNEKSYYLCSWLIPDYATRYEGKISFCLEIYKIEKIGTNLNDQGEPLDFIDQITYRWRTQPATLEVLSSPFSAEETPVDIIEYIDSVGKLTEKVEELTIKVEDLQNQINELKTQMSF